MKIIEMNIKEIKPDKNQPRQSYDEDKLNEMVETFKTQGTIQPIEIDENNIIITGELRWRCSKKAKLNTIPCKVLKGLTPEQRLERQLVENFNRQDMKLVDCIEGVKDFVKYLTKSVKNNQIELPKNCPRDDYVITEASHRLGISRVWLSQNLKFDREAPEELKQAVREKKLSVSSAVEIMRAPKEEREEITKEILEEEQLPEHRKIRERIQEKKELAELKRRNEELNKTKDYEIKIRTTEEQLSELRRQIDEEAHRLGKIYGLVKSIRKTRLYVAKPKAKEDFFKFVDGVIIKVEKWGSELRRLKDDIELEVIKE